MGEPELNVDCEDMDYPAAHSMDTTWFAVDKDGCIAVMNSNESGAVPCAHARGQTDGELFLEHLAKLRGQTLPENLYKINLSDLLGVYVYSCEMGSFPVNEGEPEVDPNDDPENFVEPYGRDSVPQNPLNTAELSELLADEAKHAMTYDGKFAQSPWLQPALLVPCQTWSEEFDNAKAVDADGVLKVIPQELRFRSAPPPEDRPDLPKIDKPPKDEFGDINFWKRHLK